MRKKQSLYDWCVENNKMYLIKTWHPEKNDGRTPHDFSYKSSESVWWLLHFNDPETGKHYVFEWTSPICNRVNGSKCPYLIGRKRWPDPISPEDEVIKATEKARSKKKMSFYEWCIENNKRYLLKEWNTEKNGNKTPHDFSPHSVALIWWKLPFDDPETGEHFDFEWCTRISNRTAGTKCPYLTGWKRWPGYNTTRTDIDIAKPRMRHSTVYLDSFEKLYSDLAKEWHPTKNGDLKPSDVSPGSSHVVWWRLPYDDPKTGKHFNFEWQARILDRVHRRNDCPYLSGRALYPGFNDLATRNPALAAQWHPKKNGELKPTDVFEGSRQIVWWMITYKNTVTGENHTYEWQEPIWKRAQKYNYTDISAVFKGDLIYDVVKNAIESEKKKICQEVVWNLTQNKFNKKDIKKLIANLLG